MTLRADGILVQGGRIVIGIDDQGRSCVSLHDEAGECVAHVSAGATAEVEMRLHAGEPLVNVAEWLSELERRVMALEGGYPAHIRISQR